MNDTTESIIKALRILANDIQSDDGVANCVIAQAADRLEDLTKENDALKADILLWAEAKEDKS